MLRHFFHWLAAASGNEGHIAFGQARRLYLAYTSTLTRRFDQFEAGDFSAAMQSAELARAEQLYVQARLHAASENRSDNLATVDYQLGMLFHLQGRLSEARQRLQSAVNAIQSRIQSSSSERSVLSGCFYHLGIISMREGDRAAAEQLLRRSLEIDEADSDVTGIGMCRDALETLATGSFDTPEQGRLPLNRSEEAGGETAATEAMPIRPVREQASDRFREIAPLSNQKEAGSNAKMAETHTSVARGAAEAIGPHEYLSGSSSGHSVLWVLSNSVEANDIYLAELKRQFSENIPGRLSIQRAAFGSPDQSRAAPPRISPGERLCGAILVLEKEGLANDSYLRWARLCLDRVAEADDFRLFVGAQDSGEAIGEFERYAGPEGRQLIDELVQTVQFPTAGNKKDPSEDSGKGYIIVPVIAPSPKEVCTAVRAYFQDVDAIRSAALMRGLRLGATALFGRIALFVQLAAVVSLSLACFAWFVLDKGAALPQWIGSHREMAGLLSGVVIFPLNTFPAYFLLRGHRAMSTMMRRRPEYGGMFITLMIVSFGIGLLVSRLDLPCAWIILGIGAGGILDHARRSGVHVRRATVSLQQCLESSGLDGTPNQLIVRGGKIADHPLIAPLFPAVRPRVFISYARRARWSADLANKLHRLLDQQGTVSFLDRVAIEAGSGWRMALNRCIAGADLFISIIEAQTTGRRWVAAEIIAALAARAVSGSPRIVVLTDTSMEGRRAGEGLPVFKAILKTAPSVTGDSQIRVINANETSLTSLASSLRPAHYETAAVFPGSWAMIFQGLTIPVVSIGTISEFIGLPAAVLFILEYWNKTSVGSLLNSHGLLTPACLVGGYLAGFGARLAASAAWEVRRGRGRGPAKTVALSFGGIAALVILWMPKIDALFAGWAILLGCAGWYLAGLFLQTVKREKPGLFGPE